MKRSAIFLAALLAAAVSAHGGNIFDDPPRETPPGPPPVRRPVPAEPKPAASEPAPATIPAAEAPPQKSPPPSASALRDALKLVNEVFQAELAAAKTPEQKKSLARQFIDAGANEKQAGRYALLIRARDLAIEAGDVEGCDAALEAIAASFDVDALKMKSDIVLLLAPNVRALADRRKLGNDLSAIAQSAIAADRFDAAHSAADAALANARSADDPALIKHAAADIQAVREAESAYAEVKKSVAILAENPKDPEANLKVGKYRCFFKGDWKSGLPLLALGDDPALKALAEKEIPGVSTTDEQVALADGWWDLADKLPAAAKQSAKIHASFWYQAAAPSLSGLAKAKAAKRIDETNASLSRAVDDASAEKRIESFKVEAFIDGDSELHLTAAGIYWVEIDAAKPGRHDGANEPTFINGKAWMPKWGIPRAERGSDRTDVLPLPLGNGDFSVEVLAITVRKGDTGIAKRDPVTIKKSADEWVISIPDRQAGAMWYILKVSRTTPKP